jgi:hypothetical protein
VRKETNDVQRPAPKDKENGTKGMKNGARSGVADSQPSLHSIALPDEILSHPLHAAERC